VHSQKFVLNDTYPQSWRKKVATQLLKRGVRLVLDDLVDDFDIKSGRITTRGGKSIPADLVVCSFVPRHIHFLMEFNSLGFYSRTSSEHQIR